MAWIRRNKRISGTSAETLPVTANVLMEPPVLIVNSPREYVELPSYVRLYSAMAGILLNAINEQIILFLVLKIKVES